MDSEGEEEEEDLEYDDEEIDGNDDEDEGRYKMVLLVRTDLGMQKGDLFCL